MKTFITEDFLLENEPARILYHNYAGKMPIYDYHCHLDPAEILANRRFDNLAQAWLGGDHYKWRLMRANGIEEKYITGPAGDEAKFQKWAELLPRCLGNPIYHWSHLELLRFFNSTELLDPQSASRIWAEAQAVLQSEGGRFRSLISHSKVNALCTTDDPADDLASHRALAADRDFTVKILPTFRPDKALHVNLPDFRPWLKRMETVIGMPIKTLDDLKQALQDRAIYFKNNGCRLSDHSFGAPDFTRFSEMEANLAFTKALAGEAISPEELASYQSVLMNFLGGLYHKLGLTMQLHLGVLRSLNTAMFKGIGADIGADSIGNSIDAHSLATLLDRLEQKACLPKTILYTLNPTDHEKLIAIAGCFQTAGTVGKMQVGSAWWFNDHQDGMEAQMKSLANLGLLSNFVGMLTDSRSVLSYTRHEYFRRILCNYIGGWVAKGQAPADYQLLGGMVEDISYNNAARSIGF